MLTFGGQPCISAAVKDPPYRMHLSLTENMGTNFLMLPQFAKKCAFSSETFYEIGNQCTKDFQQSIQQLILHGQLHDPY
jgi:hypothetical protein